MFPSQHNVISTLLQAAEAEASLLVHFLWKSLQQKK